MKMWDVFAGFPSFKNSFPTEEPRAHKANLNHFGVIEIYRKQIVIQEIYTVNAE